MNKILKAARKEIVLVVGALVAVIDFLVTNGNVISTALPIVGSLLTRTQVSPLSVVQELLALVTQVKTHTATTGTTTSVHFTLPAPVEHTKPVSRPAAKTAAPKKAAAKNAPAADKNAPKPSDPPAKA